jgi:hypothetical protein
VNTVPTGSVPSTSPAPSEIAVPAAAPSAAPVRMF